MPSPIRLARPLKLGRLTAILRVRGVEVSLHWSVLLVAAFFLLGAAERPLLTLAGLPAYLSVLLIHECGHLLAAHWRGSEVYGIELYPIFGITRYQTPWSRLDHCLIAWGGVVAQAAVAAPLVAWVAWFGYTRFEAVNAGLAILGFVSLGIAIFNLLPMKPLDGATAWGLFPALLARRRAQQKRRPDAWRR